MDINSLPVNRAIILKNMSCPYCGISLDSIEWNKEHVVGRRFVPKGTLNDSWNLIVRSCVGCNNKKSFLENDISAITLATKSWFSDGEANKTADAEVARKIKGSKSQRTGKMVLDSGENVNINYNHSGVKFGFNFKSPPQLDSDRVYELARYQLMAIFYFITYKEDTGLGGFWPGGFHPLSEQPKSDWANELQIQFMNAVSSWDIRFFGCAADGYFKVMVRRHPNAETWSWALEWNGSHRAIGFFGDRKPAQEIADAFVIEKVNPINVQNNSLLGIRIEKQLSADDDVMFYVREFA